MNLKGVVDEILLEKNRPFSWLVSQMDKTFDGLKLSLTNESIKYRDINKMAKILEVPPSTFFDTESRTYKASNGANYTAESKNEYSDLRNSLKNCKEMSAALKELIKDKDRIIALLSKD